MQFVADAVCGPSRDGRACITMGKLQIAGGELRGITEEVKNSERCSEAIGGLLTGMESLSYPRSGGEWT